MGDTAISVTQHAGENNSIEPNDSTPLYTARDKIEGCNRLYTLLLLVSSALWIIVLAIETELTFVEEDSPNGLCKGGLVPVNDMIYEQTIVEEVLLAVMVFIHGVATYGALVPNLVVLRLGAPYKKLIVIFSGFISIIIQFNSMLAVIYEARGKFYEEACKHVKPFDSTTKSDLANIVLLSVLFLVHTASSIIFILHFMIYYAGKVLWDLLCGHQRNEQESSFLEDLLSILISAWLGIRAFFLYYYGILINVLGFVGRLLWNMHRFPQWLSGHIVTGTVWFTAHAKSRWLSVKEDKNYKHSMWMMSAIVAAGVSIVYASIWLADWWSSLVVDYVRYRSCIVENKELVQDLLLGMGFGNRAAYVTHIFPGGSYNDTSIRDFFLETAENVGNTALPRPTRQCILPRYLTDMYKVVGSRLEANAYEAKGPKDPIADFKESMIGSIVLLLDAMMLHSAYVVWFGFLAAALIGVNSLVSVLARYKALSCALMHGDLDDKQSGPKLLPQQVLDKRKSARELLEERNIRISHWKELYELYSLNSVAEFLGIYVSTCIMQLVLIGGLVTCIGAIIASWRQVLEILQQASFLILTYVAVTVVNTIAGSSRPLVEKAIYEESKLGRPVLWTLYTLVRSVLNLAVGLFFSLWRLFFMLVKTFLLFNRLDRVALPRILDQGHNAFFSMVLMNVTIQTSDNDDSKRNSGTMQMTELDESQNDNADADQWDNAKDGELDGRNVSGQFVTVNRNLQQKRTSSLPIAFELEAVESGSETNVASRDMSGPSWPALPASTRKANRPKSSGSSSWKGMLGSYKGRPNSGGSTSPEMVLLKYEPL